MTRDQLIERALKTIESARLLLDSDPDLASYTVGYALEYALKARFCTKAKLASFPSDKSEAKRLQVAHAFVHDLDQLLRLTDDEHIAKENYPSVDWSVAADWSVERRYSPVGTRSVEQVQAQIEETEAAVIALCEYEILDRSRELEVELSERHGPFNFFAVWLFGDDKLQIAFSYWALDAEQQASRERAIRSALDAALGDALGSMMTAPRYYLPSDPQILAFYTVLSFIGPIQHAIRANVSNNVVVGLPPMPPAWVITCANWDKGSVIRRLEELDPEGDTLDARA